MLDDWGIDVEDEGVGLEDNKSEFDSVMPIVTTEEFILLLMQNTFCMK